MASAVIDDWATVHHPAGSSSSSSSPGASAAQQAQSQQQQKKPRHRHSPEQLAALNELFDKNEHPPLEARTALAERLAMETKTVNAWFQNKRASSKKRTRTQASDAQPGSYLNQPQIPIPAPRPPPLSAATTPGPQQHQDLDDDEQHSLGRFSTLQKVSHPAEITPGSSNSSSASFFQANPELSYFGSSRDSPDPSSMTRKMRMRPTAEQTEELKKLYNITPHPTSEDRQALAERIGMRYQSITNWFQNQRSLAKRRKEDEHTDASTNSKSDYTHNGGDMRQYSAFPPRPPHQMHPSLVSDSALVPPSSQPSLSSSEHGSRARRSPSISPSMDEQYPSARRGNMRRSTTPYGGPMQTRPRRSRPEPYQLDALKGLFTRTSTPTIEERSALALEIGMDVGKVTNWFRNLRQTARKRNNRHHGGAEQDAHGMGSGDDEDGDGDMQDDESPQYSSAVSRSASRAGTPSRFSSASSSSLGERELEARMMLRGNVPHSNIPSEDDDYPEAVTPENGRSPSPRPERRGVMHSSSSRQMHSRDLPPPHGMPMHHRDPFPSSSSPYPPHPFYHPPPSFPPPSHHHSHHPHHYNGGPLPPMNVPRDIRPPPLVEPKASSNSLGLGRFDAAVSLSSEPALYSPASKTLQPPHPYMDEDPIGCAKAAERFGIKLEDAYLLLDFKFHRH